MKLEGWKMSVAEQLARAEKLLTEARNGDAGATAVLRDLVARSARSAPTSDLIEIADFITGFLRQHVREHVAKN